MVHVQATVTAYCGCVSGQDLRKAVSGVAVVPVAIKGKKSRSAVSICRATTSLARNSITSPKVISPTVSAGLSSCSTSAICAAGYSASRSAASRGARQFTAFWIRRRRSVILVFWHGVLPSAIGAGAPAGKYSDGGRRPANLCVCKGRGATVPGELLRVTGSPQPHIAARSEQLLLDREPRQHGPQHGDRAEQGERAPADERGRLHWRGHRCCQVTDHD